MGFSAKINKTRFNSYSVEGEEQVGFIQHYLRGELFYVRNIGDVSVKGFYNPEYDSITFNLVPNKNERKYLYSLNIQSETNLDLSINLNYGLKTGGIALNTFIEEIAQRAKVVQSNVNLEQEVSNVIAYFVSKLVLVGAEYTIDKFTNVNQSKNHILYMLEGNKEKSSFSNYCKSLGFTQVNPQQYSKVEYLKNLSVYTTVIESTQSFDLSINFMYAGETIHHEFSSSNCKNSLKDSLNQCMSTGLKEVEEIKRDLGCNTGNFHPEDFF